VDGIIVPSSFVRDLFVRGGVTVPIYVVGEGVDTTIYNNTLECKLPLEFETPFNFLACGQWMAHTQMNDRKGISHLIQWFCEVFADDPKVGLVIKTHLNNDSSPDRFFARQRLDTFKNKKKLPHVYLVHGDMTDAEMAQIYRHPQIKAFVSTTSGESWGRPLAEAAASDLPILVTGWSGHMDFLPRDLVTTFEFDVTHVTQDNWVQGLIEPGSQWAFPKGDDVKRKLRRCVDGYSVAQERAVKLGTQFREKWNKKKTDDALASAFAEIMTDHGTLELSIPGAKPLML
jgi:glycosyltransferase involved in cell wall biosynthesis